ncbi:MAG: YdeI/OmpD-associated family protein [Mucilaginibacter sp.]|uniref:YdeI/OmpD-associated family protein n=1 Tax=Mucilaginibacter sp. TaxID=1882438 RepID=UPI003266501D
MVEFNTIILKFGDQGEKTGWRYIDIPADIAQQLKPGNKQSFRVKGMLDAYPIAGLALMPMGEGNFIMALKADIRKAIHKREGAMLQVKLELDTDYKVEMPADLIECFEADPEALEFFNSLLRSHRDYFVKWIEGAKTEATRIKRIVNTVNAASRRMGYPEMTRALKAEKDQLF